MLEVAKNLDPTFAFLIAEAKAKQARRGARIKDRRGVCGGAIAPEHICSAQASARRGVRGIHG